MTYKQRALAKLEGNWGKELGIVLVYLIITIAVQFIAESDGSLGLLIQLLTVPITLGYTRHILLFVRGDVDKGVQDLFYYYRTSEVIQLILLLMLINIIVFIGTIALIVPGIILGLTYTLALVIKIENPNMSIGEVMDYSKRLMYGYKWEYFVLQLSFIGWIILALFTFGIGMIPLTIYITVAQTIFYIDRVDQTSSV